MIKQIYIPKFEFVDEKIVKQKLEDHEEDAKGRKEKKKSLCVL